VRRPEIATSALVDPIIGASEVEHVYVLHQNRRADMFVDERGRLKHLRRNDGATAIYRAAALRNSPGTRAASLPWIAGPAVLFDRIVWA
jgi:hypothetical protein